MHQSGSILIITISLFLYTAVHICAAQAATLSCREGDTTCLIAAIHAANSTPEPDTLHLAAGTYTLTAVNNTTEGPNGLPSIITPMTITGAGEDQTIVERQASAPDFRLLHISPSGRVELAALTLSGGFAPSPGGGALLNGGTATLTGVTLAEHSASCTSGAVRNDGGTLTVVDSRILDNTSGCHSPGLHNIGGTMLLIRSTVSGNMAGMAGCCGGIRNDHGTLTVLDSAITHNYGADAGGGVANIGGTAMLTNVTIAHNRGGAPDGASGGLLNTGNGYVRLTNSTIAENSGCCGFQGQEGASGVSNWSGTVELRNTIVARNISDTPSTVVAADCEGVITSLGHNIFGTLAGCTLTPQATDLTGDPILDSFTDDGQPGHGHFPPLPDSPVINAGDDSACPATDQLSHLRAGTCDIGAVEFQPLLPPSLAIRLNQSFSQARPCA